MIIEKDEDTWVEIDTERLRHQCAYNNSNRKGQKDCSEHGCTGRPVAWGLCSHHRHRKIKDGTINNHIELVKKNRAKVLCLVKGCTGKISAKYVCSEHYRKLYGRGLIDLVREKVDEWRQLQTWHEDGAMLDVNEAEYDLTPEEIEKIVTGKKIDTNIQRYY